MKKVLSVLTVLLLVVGLFVGCDEVKEVEASAPSLSDNLKSSSEKVASNQSKLEKAQPAPTIDYSNERANLIKRATTFNEKNKVSYIYLFTKAGTVAGFYTVKGKVSSVGSYLVPDEQIVEDPYFKNGGYGEGKWGTMGGVVIQAPDIDGSYGGNGEGIFFYTTDDTYVEWNGEYMLCDKPLKLSTQPILTREVK